MCPRKISITRDVFNWQLVHVLYYHTVVCANVCARNHRHLSPSDGRIRIWLESQRHRDALVKSENKRRDTETAINSLAKLRTKWLHSVDCQAMNAVPRLPWEPRETSCILHRERERDTDWQRAANMAKVVTNEEKIAQRLVCESY